MKRWFYRYLWPSLLATLCVVSITSDSGIAWAAPAGPTMRGDAQAVAEVTAAFEKFRAARSWRAKMVVSSPQGSITILSEHVAPDRLRMVMTVEGVSTEITVIGQRVWTRSQTPGQAGCVLTPGRLRFPDPREVARHDPGTIIDVTKGGGETIEGVATQTYQLIITTQGTQLRQKVFIATGSGQFRRIESTTQQGTLVSDYSDFDAPIAIEPPC